MPRDHGRILCGIWRDNDFRARSVDAQRLYMLLLSQPNVNNAGLLPLQVSKWAKGCDATTAASIQLALDELVEHRFVFYDEDTEECLVRSYMRNDGVMAHKYIWKNALKCCEAVESPVLREVLASELARTRRSDAAEIAARLLGREPEPDPGGMPFECDSDGIETASEPESSRTSHSDGISITAGKGLGKGEGSPSVGGYVGERRPECSKHETNYEGGHCRPCQKRREWDDAHESDELDAKRQLRESRHAAMLACKRCDKFGWALDDTDMPIEPAVKCTAHLQEAM